LLLKKELLAISGRALAADFLLKSCGCAQCGSLVRLFPGELGLLAAEVAVGGSLLVDRAQQVEHLDDALGPQVEVLQHQLRDLLVGEHARALGVDRDVHRPRHADGVGHLDLALARQACGHDVLGHVARSVGGAAVHLRRVLAAERAAAVRAGAAVGVHDDLAARQPAVALRAADDEAARGVDEVLGVLQPGRRQHGLDDLLDDGFGEAGLHLGGRFALVGAVLGGEHHGVDAVGLAIHVAHRDLALGVGAQEGQAAVLAQLRLALDQAVRVVDRRGHQLGRFVAGVAEHQALVAGAGVQVVVARVVHSLGDVVALLVVGHEHGAAFVVDAVVGVVVADALDGVARHLDVVHVGVGGDLAGQHHQAGVCERLGGHARARVLFKDCVEDGVRDLVCDLVGMALGDGFGSEEKVVRHL